MVDTECCCNLMFPITPIDEGLLVPLAAYGLDDGMLKWFRYGNGYKGPAIPAGGNVWTTNTDPGVLLDDTGAIILENDGVIAGPDNNFNSYDRWEIASDGSRFYRVVDEIYELQGEKFAKVWQFSEEEFDVDETSIPYAGSNLGGGIVLADELYIIDHGENGFRRVPTAYGYSSGETMNVGQTGFTNFSSFDINSSRKVALGYSGGTGGYGIFAVDWGGDIDSRVETFLGEGRAEITESSHIIGPSFPGGFFKISVPPHTSDDKIFVQSVGNDYPIRRKVIGNTILIVAQDGFGQQLPFYAWRGNVVHAFDDRGTLLWTWKSQDYGTSRTSIYQLIKTILFEAPPGFIVIGYNERTVENVNILRLAMLNLADGSVVWNVRWKDDATPPGGSFFSWVVPNLQAGQIVFSSTPGYPDHVPFEQLQTEPN